MNTEQIRALDRSKTAVLIPGGILEQHGPYLPSYTDGYLNEALTQDLAAAIVRRPGWTAAIFPSIPLGSGGANEIAAKLPFPGTYAVRPETLRAIFMDLAEELGQQGFRWIFLLHGHGAPLHNQALDDAGDYFRDTYGGRMIHLVGFIFPRDLAKHGVAKEAIEENGFEVHAGLAETSQVMALRPDLVSRTVSDAPSFGPADPAALGSVVARPDWPGYVGAPRYATADLGRSLTQTENEWFVTQALRILDGKADERQMPRASAATQDEAFMKVLEPAKQRDAAMARRQREWLAARDR
jgi:creatinine amidohydrolase/Fe(II)-dependent formamide hydrolase-like protein